MSLILNGTDGVTFNDSSLQGAAASPYVNKNRLINGAMNVWQRGTSFSTTGLHGADRWKMQLVGTTTLSQETSVIPTGSQYALKWTTGAASSYGQIRQFIETVNLYDLIGQTVTASAQVRCNATFSGNLQFEIGYATTGDASTASYTVISGTSTGTVNSSGYTTITWTGTIPSNTLGLYVGIVPSVVQASGAIAYMGNVQLEVGTSATPFERRLYNQELANCQRYYYKITAPNSPSVFGESANADSATGGEVKGHFPVTMRTYPTALEQSGTASHYIIRTGGVDRTCSAVPTYNSLTNYDTWRIITTVASGQTAGLSGALYSNSSSAYLAWSAEL